MELLTEAVAVLVIVAVLLAWWRSRRPRTWTTRSRSWSASDEFRESFLLRDPRGLEGFQESPFGEPIGRKAGVVCFARDADDEALWTAAEEDLTRLRRLPTQRCYYGAGAFDLEPFLASGPADLSVSALLSALHVRNFQRGVSEPRDEAHTDPAAQDLFYVAGRDEDDDQELALEPESRTEAAKSHEAHQSLRALVDGPLWYLLLHDDGELPRPMVALLAIGRSKRGSHLIGVATQQWYRGLRG